MIDFKAAYGNIIALIYRSQITQGGLTVKNGRHKQKNGEQLLSSPAQIAVARRESSGLNSFAVWDFFLNGENIGKIEDGGTVTVETNQRSNVLEAKGPSGAVSTVLEFLVETGAHAEVVFNVGKFVNSQGMSMVLPVGKAKGVEKIIEIINSKKWGWAVWAVLIGYSTAVFFLTREIGFFPVLILSSLPFLASVTIARYASMAMVAYFYYDQPDGRAALEEAERLFWNSHSGLDLSYFNQEIEDPEYQKLRKGYKRISYIGFFSMAAIIATFIYDAVTIARN